METLNPFFIYFLISAALAGVAVLWRTWLFDHPSWKKFIHKNLGPAHKALTCGSCFSYWITLAFLLFENPLAQEVEAILGTGNYAIILFVSWMAFSWGVVTLRFLYVLIQERVSVLAHRDGKTYH